MKRILSLVVTIAMLVVALSAVPAVAEDYATGTYTGQRGNDTVAFD